MHTYIHTYIHTYMHTYICVSIHTYIRTYLWLMTCTACLNSSTSRYISATWWLILFALQHVGGVMNVVRHVVRLRRNICKYLDAVLHNGSVLRQLPLHITCYPIPSLHMSRWQRERQQLRCSVGHMSHMIGPSRASLHTHMTLDAVKHCQRKW